ncbi:MAG: AI-2E family transporter [Chloroflexota bacterium]
MYAGSIFRRYRRLLFFVVGVIVFFVLLYVLRSVVFPFVIAWLLAFLLLPVIRWAEAKLPRRGEWRGTKRVSLIILIYLVALGLAGLFSYYIVISVAKAIVVIVENAPQYFAAAVVRVQQWAADFRAIIPMEIQREVDSLMLNAGATMGNAIRTAFMRGLSFIPSTVGTFFGLAALPIFLFFILKDWERLASGFYTALPAWVAEHTRNIISIIDVVLLRYVRAQLILGFVVFYLSFVGLVTLRIDYALALAAFAGVTELIPVLGPWISGVVAVVITLALAPEKAIWVALLFVAVQLLENGLFVPRIQGSYFRIHPAVVIILLVLGVYIAGIWGMILAVPLTATVIEIYKYVRNRARAEGAEPAPQP